jgi:hypothetical protein
MSANPQLHTDHGAVDVSLPAGEDLTAKQYFFVKVVSGEIVFAGANEKSLGILQNAPDDGEVASVRIQGISKLKLAEGVTFGKYLTPTSTGAGEVVDAANEEVGARSLGTYDTGDIGEVQLMQFKCSASDA